MDFQTETLVLVCGPQASGKSTFLKNVRWEDPRTGELRMPPQGSVLSADYLRTMFFGTGLPFIDHKVVMQPRALNDGLVWQTLLSIVETRMRERMTTFVEMMLLTESERNELAKLAQKNGMEVHIVMLSASADELVERNKARAVSVPKSHLLNANDSFVKDSAWPTTQLSGAAVLQTHIVRERRLIPADVPIDAIGDVHGLLEPLLALLEKLGYVLDEQDVPRHPQGRKLLFLGDMVDRGPHSLEVLELVRKAVELGGHYAVRGNHENKLLGFLLTQEKGELSTSWSVANARTGMELLQQEPEQRARLEMFLRELPGYYVQGDIFFAHADLARTVVPGDMALSECCYGKREMGSDDDSDALFELSNPHYRLVRGHIPATRKDSRAVVVVYDFQEYGGTLPALRLNEAESNLAFAADHMVSVPTHFNYTVARDTPEALLKRQLEKLVTQKLVTRAYDASTGLAVYKYAKKVFFDNLWNQHPALLRARGIVFDITNRLVQNPFTKVFNHHENGTELDGDTWVVVTDKMNGYFTAVSQHPAKYQELLVTTTGSMDSDFVKLSQAFIREERAYGPLMRELRKLEPLSLMFEVVHPDDPHIVQQSKSDYGLYLIGARPLQANSPEWTEEALDGLAQQLGSCVKRPAWRRMRFSDLVEMAQKAVNVEGWMVREDTAEQKTLMKKKSSWYLTTKLLGRLSEGKIKHMYANPQSFKQRVDEEFFPLVDAIVQGVPEKQFLGMEDSQRVAFVAGLIA